MAMDHQYIDANAVAERYLGNRLRLEEREDFERHLMDCQECIDRILLAGMFHARSGNGSRAPHGAAHGATDGPGVFDGPHASDASRAFRTPHELDTPLKSKAYGESQPPALFVRVKPLQLLWILLITAFLLVTIPAVVLWIFEDYSGI
jgi:hypothetical protein